MILPGLRLLLLLLLTGEIRPGAPSTPDRPAHHRPSEPPPGTALPADGTPPDPESPTRPHRTDSTGSATEPPRTETATRPNTPEIHLHSVGILPATESPSEPNRTDTPLSSHPNRTKTRPPQEPDRTDTDNPNGSQEPETHFPNRTNPDSPSLPDSTDTGSPVHSEQPETRSQPNRTDTPFSSHPNGTGTRSPSEPSSPDPRSRWQTHKAGLLYGSDEGDVRPVSANTGRENFRWDAGGTDPNIGRTDEQTSSASGITQRSVTRRHISKRTPNMDTTYVSTTGDQTLVSVTKNTNMSDVTQNPTASTTDVGSAPTNTGTEETGSVPEGSGNQTFHSGGVTYGLVSRAKDSGNTTQGSVTVMQDSENSTETSRLNKTDSELSASITYPLQTPSYLVTTYPSPTSDQVPESSAPFTSIPVTAPNTTSHVPGTDVPASESTFASSSPSSTNSSLFTFPASSSELSSSTSEVAQTAFNRSSSDVSSSPPIPSTLVPFSTFSTFPSEASPKFPSTKVSAPQTTLQTTPELPSTSSLPSVPPSSHTTSSSDDNIETSTSFRTSLPTFRTDQTSEAYSSSTPGLGDAYTTEAGQRFLDGTTTSLKDLVTTWRSVLETPTSVTSPKDGGTQSIATTTHVSEPPAQPTSPVSLTTSVNFLIPSPHYSTQWPHQDTLKTTRPGGPALTTGDPSKQVTTIRTTSMDTRTVVPKVEITTSSKERKVPAHTTTQPGVVTVKYSTTTATSPPTPAAPPSPSLPAPVNVCSPNPCRNGGSCVLHGDHQKRYRCECPAAWQGQHCDSDVDECLSKPCPAPSTCVNLRGSFTCRCPLGYIMEKGTGCVQVRTFLGHIEIPRSFLNGSNGKFTKLQQIEEEIVQILNSSFSAITGYYQSSVTNSSFSNRIELSVQNLFLLSSNVTLYDLRHHIQRYKKGCQSAPQHSPACQLILHSELYYIAVSMCNMKNLGCDNETSDCADPAGVAQCQCKAGFFKYSVMDRSCRACDDGYRLQDGACVRCPFGLGGFNCSNPYQLITVIISAAGGGLLLILGIALAVTCCRKSRHDISKLIFKSGDFQMSPYAEYPKAQRSSEWGRETIEMQENGSTKNLLQMTDVYYSPGLRNSDIERNGLYPYAGLPGSRHSCIYPGQYNPTFINEENRRRDYF